VQAREIKSGVYSVGAIDWDRRFFEELTPLPDGTSYNSYLIQGSEKTVLIDTVDPTMTEGLIESLTGLNIGNIDFVVANHAEQDHSGSLPVILERYPHATVICSPKCKPMLNELLRVSEDRISTVEDKEKLSLGDRTLEFIHAPWVHWPETMLTYLHEDKILFPCDLFGSHLATSDLFIPDDNRVFEPAKRYYAEIMMPFRANIERHLERLKDYEISLIAPSHGPVYPHPDFILNAYKKWVSAPPSNTVVLPYVSMHGSTKKMVEYFVESLIQKGVKVEQFNLVGVDIGKLAEALVDAATLVIASPTFIVGPHPLAANATFLINTLRPKTRFASIIGSYGWGSQARERLMEMLPNLKAEFLEPVVIKGLPGEEDYKSLDNLATAIAEKHKSIQ